MYGKQLGWLGDREGGRREPLRRTRTAAVNTRRPPSRAAHAGARLLPQSAGEHGPGCATPAKTKEAPGTSTGTRRLPLVAGED
ncbi:MAG: hypothetical protein JWN34_4756 [Bryobacterales bacterium]|nr:hypothetical protein [Bryobacterales bacterium]